MPHSHKDCGLNVPLGTVRKDLIGQKTHISEEKKRGGGGKKKPYYVFLTQFLKIIKAKSLGDKIQISNYGYVTRKGKQYTTFLPTH